MKTINTVIKVKVIGIAIMAICNSSLGEQPEMAKLPLVPYPQQVTFQEGVFVPAANLVFHYDKDNQEVVQIVETLGQDLAALGFAILPGNAPPSNKASIIKLSLRDDQDLGREGYRLKIDATVSISAASADGLFWATRTLLQLMHSGPQKAVPQLTIFDKPEFEYRGLMIDTARCFHTINFHIETVKRLAALKLNRYQIHFSDHQSYTLPSEAFPTLPTKDRHYTKAEIKELVDAANKYHVMIVPEIDVPGHSAALIRGISKLACGGRGGSRKLCIGKEYTYEVLEKLFSEIMDMIPGEYWHLGADEVSYNGTSCKGCAAKMKQESFKEGAQLYHYFINRMHGFIKGKGRKMLVWEGFSPTLDPKIDKDIIVCPFDVKHRGHMPNDYFQAGYKVLNTSWTPLYVADRIYMTTPEIIARWSPYMFGAGRSPQPFAYWKKFKPEDYRGKIIGGQMCSWEIEEKAEEGLLFGTGPGFYEYGRSGPRLQIMAERVWTGSGTNAKDLLERVGVSYW